MLKPRAKWNQNQKPQTKKNTNQSPKAKNQKPEAKRQKPKAKSTTTVWSAQRRLRLRTHACWKK